VSGRNRINFVVIEYWDFYGPAVPRWDIYVSVGLVAHGQALNAKR